MEASRSPRFTDPPPNSDPVTKLTHLMSGTGWALQLGLLHLIPMASLNLLMAVTTVHTASAIHVGVRPVRLQEFSIIPLPKPGGKDLESPTFLHPLSPIFL